MGKGNYIINIIFQNFNRNIIRKKFGSLIKFYCARILKNTSSS